MLPLRTPPKGTSRRPPSGPGTPRSRSRTGTRKRRELQHERGRVAEHGRQAVGQEGPRPLRRPGPLGGPGGVTGSRLRGGGRANARSPPPAHIRRRRRDYDSHHQRGRDREEAEGVVRRPNRRVFAGLRDKVGAAAIEKIKASLVAENMDAIIERESRRDSVAPNSTIRHGIRLFLDAFPTADT